MFIIIILFSSFNVFRAFKTAFNENNIDCPGLHLSPGFFFTLLFYTFKSFDFFYRINQIGILFFFVRVAKSKSVTAPIKSNSSGSL